MAGFDLNIFMPAIIALIGAGGLWQLLSLKAKQAHEARLADKAERGEFNETLREQVERLASKLDAVTEKNETLLVEMAELKAQLAAAQTTIKHLEAALMKRG